MSGELTMTRVPLTQRRLVLGQVERLVLAVDDDEVLLVSHE
jgi:hypothetical protein